MPKTKPTTQPANSNSKRAGLLARANHVSAVLVAEIESLAGGEDASDAMATWIDRTYHALFKNEKARPWLDFVRSIDHASRISLVNPNYPDTERAKVARGYFRAYYADLEVKLTDDAVVAAVTAWRTQKDHWQAIHAAVVEFYPDAPTPRNMSRAWQNFPHLPAPRIPP